MLLPQALAIRNSEAQFVGNGDPHCNLIVATGFPTCDRIGTRTPILSRAGCSAAEISIHRGEHNVQDLSVQ